LTELNATNLSAFKKPIAHVLATMSNLIGVRSAHNRKYWFFCYEYY